MFYIYGKYNKRYEKTFFDILKIKKYDIVMGIYQIQNQKQGRMDVFQTDIH